MTSAMTPGSLIVVAVFMNNDGNTLSFSGVSDPTNGNYTALGNMLVGVGALAGYSSQMFYFSNQQSNAEPNITLTISAASSFCGIAIHEYTGAPYLQNYAYLNLNSNTPVPQSIEALYASDLVFAYGVPATSVSSVASPFTLREDANWATSGTADDTSPVVGLNTVEWTISSPPTDNMMGMAVFTQTPWLPASGKSFRHIPKFLIDPPSLARSVKR
jgi:hypothetical protein